jgi:pseudolysin
MRKEFVNNQGVKCMRKYYHLFAMSAVALACSSSAFAAKAIDLNHQAASTLSIFAGSKLTAASSLQQISSDVDQNKTTHVRIRETFANYPVWGSDAVIHIPQGGSKSLNHLSNATTMNGVVFDGLQADLANTPAYVFSAAQADKALQQATQIYQKNTGVQTVDLLSAKKELMVYVDKNSKAHWAYHIAFISKDRQGSIAVPTFILDASAFTVYENWNDAQTLDDVKGGGFGGNPKMGKLSYDGLTGDYPSLDIQRDGSKNICYLKNETVSVLDAGKPFSFPFSDAPVAEFSCQKTDSDHNNEYWDADLDATNGAYSPENDALYIGKVIVEMYQKWFGLSALVKDGKPLVIKMNVHAKELFHSEPMENAMFLPMTNQMYYGDGLDHFYPLTSLGVGAHEISHGFTSQHSNLTYQQQSGGMNESFSDMAAQAAEFYSTGQNSWQIGPEIVKGNGALRYMDDPTKDGHSIGNAKDYNDSLNVHYTSGVFNKLFYLLSTAKDWDTKKAFGVMVNANMHYWTANSTYQDAACGAVKAAKDLKYDVTAVVAAINGVGIDASHC